MMNSDLTVEEMHHYLRGMWFGYSCADKEEVTRIIEDELSKPHQNMGRNKLKLHIKRRCQAETGR